MNALELGKQLEQAKDAVAQEVLESEAGLRLLRTDAQHRNWPNAEALTRVLEALDEWKAAAARFIDATRTGGT